MTTSRATGRVVSETRSLLDAQNDPEVLRRSAAPAIRLLADGQPVSLGRIAEASALPIDQVQAALRDTGDIEWTADGRVEGFGLTRRPTPHRIRIGEQDMYTWCAMDTLIFAVFLDRTVQISSPDAATGETLRLETDGRQVIGADPPSIVLSWFVDPAATGIRAATCQFGHFFASHESAAAWAAQYPEGGVLTLDEAMDAARRMVSDVFGAEEGTAT